MSKKFYEFKNSTDNTVDLYFYGDIVADSWYDWWDDETQYPQSIKDFLDEANGKDLNIYINSYGGHVSGGLAIYNMLKRYKGHKNVHVDGYACSIASVIALAGDTVTIPKTSLLMIHKPYNMVYDNLNADECRKMADDLDRIEQCILNVYEENLKDGVSIDTVKALVDAETWLTGDQAAEYFNIIVSDDVAVACNEKSDFINKYKKAPYNLDDFKIKETQDKSEKNEQTDELELQKNNLTLEIDLI